MMCKGGGDLVCKILCRLRARVSAREGAQRTNKGGVTER